jgi:hypothetical protein
MEETQEQSNNRPWLFKKGQSGNPGGRPKGSKSLKERAREYLAGLSDEETEAYFDGLNKLDVWKMAEGNPATETDITSKGEKIFVLPAELINKNGIRTDESTKGDSTGQP